MNAEDKKWISDFFDKSHALTQALSGRVMALKIHTQILEAMLIQTIGEVRPDADLQATQANIQTLYRRQLEAMLLKIGDTDPALHDQLRALLDELDQA